MWFCHRESVDLACTTRIGTLPRCRSIHKTADGTTAEKLVSSGKQRKQASATVVLLTTMQYKETQSVNL